MPTEDYNVDPVKTPGTPVQPSATAGPADSTQAPGNALPEVSHHVPEPRTKRPAFCAHCNFNLRAWRERNSIPDLNAPFL